MWVQPQKVVAAFGATEQNKHFRRDIQTPDILSCRSRFFWVDLIYRVTNQGPRCVRGGTRAMFRC